MTSKARFAKRQHHILCIDDYAPGLEVRTALLEKWGYSVSTAGSAEDGLTAIRQGDVDLIILDYCLPGMNGGELLKIVKADWPGVRVVLLSGYPRISHKVKTSADAFLRKGDPNEYLRSVLANLLETGTRRMVTRSVEETRKLVARASTALRRNQKSAG
ncbi:MAG: response regulator [Terriglobales bacterium]